MKLKVTVFVVLSCFFVVPSESARILGIIPTASYSHQIAFRPLWKELLLRGHELVVMTTNPMNDPSLTGLTEIDLHSSYDAMKKYNMFNMSHLNLFELTHLALEGSNALLDHQLQHPEVKKMLQNESEHFDLVFAEVVFPTMFTFSERFQCPFIEVSSYDAPVFSYYIIGNPPHPVLNPEIFLPFSEDLTFPERLFSVGYSLYEKYLGTFYFYPAQNALIKKHFGNGYPPLDEIMKKVSMMFINTNPFLHKVRPLVPAIVEIGGGNHLKPSGDLPKDLQKLLDGASQGFIYLSLGSNVKSEELPDSTRNAILQTLAELPYLVLWKFEADELPGKPWNVIISKWFPQQEILRHRNIKLFISQGGLQSMEEAILSRVPMVGMPFFGDQPGNVEKIVRKGVGLKVDHQTLTKASFKSTILEIIKNPRYRNNVKQLAEFVEDQPMTGLERAVWWTEYVLRHKGAKHLRSPAIDIPYYQYFLVDVIGFCLLIILALMSLFVVIIKCIFKLCRCFKTSKKEKLQ